MGSQSKYTTIVKKEKPSERQKELSKARTAG